jgi:hypothetical protein
MVECQLRGREAELIPAHGSHSPGADRKHHELKKFQRRRRQGEDEDVLIRPKWVVRRKPVDVALVLEQALALGVDQPGVVLAFAR